MSHRDAVRRTVIFDASYIAFYKIYAIRAWHRHASRAWDEEALAADPAFKSLLREKTRQAVGECRRRHWQQKESTAPPPRCFFCIDGQQATAWRRAIFPGYKANRKLSDAYHTLFGVALDEIKRICAEDDLCYALEHAHLEADDVAHALVRRLCDGPASPSAGASGASSASGESIVIVASDHDYLPLLVYPNVHIETATGVVLQLPSHIASPALALETKIVMGDKSDCIPPIAPRVGKKTAAALLANGGAALRAKLESSADCMANYERNKQLVDNTMLPPVCVDWLRDELATV
jgi:5'-3' exonuclease